MPTTFVPSGSFNPTEIRRLVARGRELGLVRDANAPLDKSGTPVANHSGLRAVWIDVTPAQAEEWLTRNFRNRSISEDVVAAYARDMANGVWAATHQGIAFNDRDELVDGQHRLKAIIASGRTVRMMVTFGLPAKIKDAEVTTMDAIDRGRTRSVADQLKIQHGMKNGSVIAAVTATLGTLCYGERTRRLSVGQTLEIFRAFEPEVLWLIERRSKEHGLRAAGVLAAFAFALAAERGAKDTKIAAAYELLVGDAKIEAGRPLRYLRDFLRSDEARLLSRGTDRGVAELVLSTLHLEAQGKAAEIVTLGHDGRDFFRAKQTERADKIASIFTLPV